MKGCCETGPRNERCVVSVLIHHNHCLSGRYRLRKGVWRSVATGRLDVGDEYLDEDLHVGEVSVYFFSPARQVATNSGAIVWFPMMQILGPMVAIGRLLVHPPGAIDSNLQRQRELSHAEPENTY